MKLMKAEIDGFGQLHRRQVPLDAPVIIVYGPNEAGKSTVFGFVRSMLYGFAKRGQPSERQEPVNGGRHGGRLFFCDARGSQYVLERYAADGSGKLKLREIGHLADAAQQPEDKQSLSDGAEAIFAEGAWLSQSDWERQFLGGISERLYRQLFAVTLTELQEVGTLPSDELGRYLYQAGWDDGKTIAAAEKRLAQEMEALFKPRGTNQQINQQLKTLEQLEAALRKRTDAIASYNDLVQQTARLDESIRSLDKQLPAMESRQKLLNKACSARPLWIRKEQLLLEREQIAYAARLSVHAEKSWEELLRQRAEYREEMEKHRQKALLLELQLEAISYDEQLIRLGDETEALLQSSESMRKLAQDSAEREAELREHDEMIARLVTSIAPEWTERQLRELQVTVADRDYVREARQQELEQSRTEERFAAELETLKQQEREAVSALEEARSAVERDAARREQGGGTGFEVLPRTRDALKGAWNALDSALREWELERARTAGAAGAASDSGAGGRGAAAGAGRGGAGPLWAAAAGAGGAALALWFAAADKTAGGTVLAALALAVAALVLAAAAVLRSRSAGRAASNNDGLRGRGLGRNAAPGDRADHLALSEREQRIYQALETMVREPQEAAAALLAAKHHSSAEHMLAAEQARTQLRAAVEARLEAIQTSERLIDNSSELARRLERLRAHAAGRSEAAAAAAQTRQALARQWAGWLAARSLPAGMSPAAALEAFDLAEQALQRLQQYDRLAAKQAAAGKQLAAFAKQAADLCGQLEEAKAQLAADPALALRLLHAEIRRHTAAKQEARGILARRDELHMAMQAADSRLQELQALIAAQIKEAGLASEAQYELAAQHRRDLQELELELSKLTLEMTAGLSEERIAELEELFRLYDEEQLQAMQTDSSCELEDLEKRKREQLEQRGSLRQSLEHLLKEEEHQKLLSDKEMTIAKLEADAERYAVLSISAALISRTKRIYEEERQPVVLRNASRLIAKLTDGKYIRVLTTPGEPGIRLETSDNRLIDSALLSRGTAEQVYLAMRFALAEEASLGTKLPLMLDDVFVNFDRGRLHAVTGLLAELSGDRQMIVMTCHEHVRDAMLEHCNDAVLVQI
ncbi:AAA family ATPase [Paenibacillus sp. PL91]|uniref:AAA family ATPase n=1 Tax=Paenibacillus sp. PL91 TaxID=2729538 RepID=UPI00145D11B8|nr:AAA family ATPase [Paenibacillus sp. PL91]MBC9199939.1 AAA family ATPase [Paenibacillus sp. PL91]